MDKTELEQIENFIINANQILHKSRTLVDTDWRGFVESLNRLIITARWENVNVPYEITQLRLFIENDPNPKYRYTGGEEWIERNIEYAKEAIRDMEYDYGFRDD